MAWEVVEKGSYELEGLYPKFESVGDYAEGNFMGIEEDDFGNKRIVLFKGNDEDGLPIEQWLPSHADLKKYYNELTVGDYIRVELIKIIPSNNEKYSDKNIYKVLVDHTKDVEFGDDDE